MQSTIEQLDKGRVKLTIEVPVAETEEFLNRAAERLSQKQQIAGFRPGKAPREVIERQFGATALYEEAIDAIVAKTLWNALKEHSIESVGRPEIAVQKLAPGNPIVYTATVALMPTVTLGDWQNIRIASPAAVIADADIDKVIEDLRNMQATEALVDRAAQKGDKVEINFTVMRDGVVIDGGTGKKFPLVIGAGSMIPGFEDHIIGLKATEKKDFTLSFPKPYMQESLAGKDASFSIEMLAVYERVLPEKTDEWAKRVIGKSYAELRMLVKGNLEMEKQEQTARKQENDIIERLIDRAKFSVLPDVMIQSEIEKMLAELEDDIQQRGMQWDAYLKSIKRTKEDLKKEFAPNAEKRVQGALILRTLAKELSVQADKEELEGELSRQRDQYAANPEILARVNTEEFKRYVALSIQNRKVMEKLKEKLVQQAASQ